MQSNSRRRRPGAAAGRSPSRRGRRLLLKPGDVLLTAAVMLTAAVIGWRVYADPEKPAVVHIQAADGEWFYPLDRSRAVDVNGPLGVTKVLIEDGAVRVLDSPCTLKTCVHTGAVSRTGGWIACLPNRVLVTVEGRHESAYDAETY